MNRSRSRPSHERAAAYVDNVIVMLKSNGWRSILLRGDTDSSQTEHLDRWERSGVESHFGYDATPNLKQTADELPEYVWTKLDRPSCVRLTENRRQQLERVNEQIVIDRELKNFKLLIEDIAEFEDQRGGDEWVKRFFLHLHQCPQIQATTEATALKQAMNWLVRASAAAR